MILRLESGVKSKITSELSSTNGHISSQQADQTDLGSPSRLVMFVIANVDWDGGRDESYHWTVF